MRETEYGEAAGTLKKHRRYECVLKLCVFNEHPAFLNPHLHSQAVSNRVMAAQLTHTHSQLCEGLDILAALWRRKSGGDS